MSRRIDFDAIINSVRLKRQLTNPTTPASGYDQLFADATGLHLLDSSGNVKDVSPKQFIFTVTGTLVAAADPIRIPNHTGRTMKIKGVYLDIGTAPTGDAIIVDIHKSGTTIFTTQSNRPQIAIGAFAGNSTTIEVSSWADGAYLTAEIDQIGSTIAGANLTITVVAE